MNIYLAAPYAHKMHMREIRLELQAAGHTVTSSWLDGPWESDHELFDRVQAACAVQDTRDIDASDIVVLFPAHGGSGCYDEFGYARGRGKQRIVVGDRTNIFQYMHDVAHVADVDDLLAYLCGAGIQEQTA